MCRYCEKHNCWICTTPRGSSNCLHCEQHDNFTFKWNYCPWCGEKYRVIYNGLEYIRDRSLDIDERKAYKCCHNVPINIEIIFVDNDGNIGYLIKTEEG